MKQKLKLIRMLGMADMLGMVDPNKLPAENKDIPVLSKMACKNLQN